MARFWATICSDLHWWARRVSSIVWVMTVRGWGRVLLATLLLNAIGCSGASSADNAYTAGPGDYHGGQTGSLRPCSTPWETSQGGTVPAGDAALVFHTGCTAGSEITLTDQNGELIAFEMVELDDGVVLLRADAALEPGDYRVETPDGSEQTLTVTEPAPLPMKLGTLTRVADSCSLTFRLELDPAVLPYLSLLRLEYSLVGSARLPWFEYGTVPENSAAPLLAVDGLTPGPHRLEVFPSLAGETMVPDTAVLDFVHDCHRAEPPESGSCALPASLRSGAGAGLAHALPGLILVLLLRLRRRREAIN
jgi:hypothetical protein